MCILLVTSTYYATIFDRIAYVATLKKREDIHMLKKTLAACIMLLSTPSLAESAPDCSPDKDARVLLGLTTSLNENKLESYEDKIINNRHNLKIRLLSSNKINKEEKEKLLIRRIKKNNYNKKDIKDSGITIQYMESKIYRQYYDIKIPGEFHAIAEIYSVPHNCAVDIGEIHLISNSIDGNTPNFAAHAYTPY